MENTEISTEKLMVAARIDPVLFDVLEQVRISEDRTMSNMIERLLKTHPHIQELFVEAQSAQAV